MVKKVSFTTKDGKKIAFKIKPNSKVRAEARVKKIKKDIKKRVDKKMEIVKTQPREEVYRYYSDYRKKIKANTTVESRATAGAQQAIKRIHERIKDRRQRRQDFTSTLF